MCAILHNFLLHDFYGTLWTNKVDVGDTNGNSLKDLVPFSSIDNTHEKDLRGFLKTRVPLHLFSFGNI
jgi:hypothetical protein